MIGTYNLFTIPTFSLSWTHMIFFIVHNPKITFTTIIHKLTNRFMLLRLNCLMLCKTDPTTKCSFTVHTTLFLSRNTRNVTIATIKSISTSVGSPVRISNITILAVVMGTEKSSHLRNHIIVIYSIEVNMDHPRLRLLLELKWKYHTILRILRIDFDQVLGSKYRLDLLVFLNTTRLGMRNLRSIQ